MTLKSVKSDEMQYIVRRARNIEKLSTEMAEFLIGRDTASVRACMDILDRCEGLRRRAELLKDAE